MTSRILTANQQIASLSLENADISWHPILKQALRELPEDYLNYLKSHDDWIPGLDKVFNSFSLPISKVRFILFGEAPYPRKESANGFAFWDASVQSLWSSTGLSKKVNRAVSLRNIIKMLLIAQGELSPDDLSQSAIAKINKENYVQTIDELFHNFLDEGFMLLNLCLALTPFGKRKDANAWRPFIEIIFNYIAKQRAHIEILLFGHIARCIKDFTNARQFKQIVCEHPYNHTFITEPQLIAFFKPLNLLIR